MGPSLSSGARDAGRVRRQPVAATRDTRKACSGPGWTAAAKANPEPKRRYSSMLRYLAAATWAGT